MSTGGALDARRVAGWLVAAAIAAGATLGPAGSAGAKPYDVWSCRGPSGTAVGTAAWEWEARDAGGSVLDVLEPPAGVEFADDCPTGGGRSVALGTGSLLQLGGAAEGLLRFRAPPDTAIASYDLSGLAQSGAPPAIATYSYRAGYYETLAGQPVTGMPCVSPGCMLGSSDANAAGSLVVRDPAEGDALELRVGIDCGLACLGLIPSGTPPRIVLYRSRVTLDDPHPPEPPQLGGGLVEPGAAAGRATLTVTGHDRGGGIEAMSLAIDGQPWQTLPSSATVPGCRVPYSAVRPCPADVAQTFEIDTGALAPGDHRASGTIVDAAGNSTPWGPVPFRVAIAPIGILRTPPVRTPPPGPSNGSPAVERPRLRLARDLTEAVAGTAVRVRGRLTTREGAPVARARLSVAVRQLGLRGSVPTRRRPAVVTDAAGRFAVEQRAVGAQRLTVSFSPRPNAAATAQAAAVVRGRLGLRTAPSAARLVKGRLLTLRGRLVGAGPSAQGALVQIQAIVNGRWRPVGRARTGRRGAYAWRYRFVHLTRDTAFRFRAVVEHVPGWPWPTVRSAPATVRVDVP